MIHFNHITRIILDRILISVLIMPGTAPAFAGGTQEDYERAKSLRGLFGDKVFRSEVEPNWLEGGTHFWYRIRTGGDSYEFILVDAENGRRGLAFDHGRVAGALRQTGAGDVDAANLPLEKMELDLSKNRLAFQAEGKAWECDLETYSLKDMGAVPEESLPAYTVESAPRASRRSGRSTALTFVNRTGQAIELFWLDTSGRRVSYGKVMPGEERTQNTYGGHVWLVAGEDGEPICVYQAADRKARAVIGLDAPRPFERRGRRRRSPEEGRGPSGAASPDGSWEAFIREHDVGLRKADGGGEVLLTEDGEEGDGYVPRFFWSPDSRKLVVQRRKQGEEHKVHFIESSPRDQVQPKLHSFDYRKPGDHIDVEKPCLFDIETRSRIPVSGDLFSNPYQISGVRWAPDSTRFTFVYNQRGHQVLRVVAVDAESGTARSVIEETAETFICYSSKFFAEYLDDSDEIIWMSERDGWNHLYLYDAGTGRVKNQITRGPWVVRGVDRVDRKERRIWFRAGGIHPGQDPYHVHYCRIDFDGTSLTLLTEGDGTHSIRFSPDRRYFVDTWSRVDLPPVHELRRSEDGTRICDLERADWSALLEAGWQIPERFTAKGRDGQTDIYGVLFRPTRFDPDRKYPVIEEIYAGPHGSFVPKSFRDFHPLLELAELGFILVKIDGMGTSNRSKAFHDVCWKNLADSGLPDRIAWIQDAAERYPWMDISRVGIYGGSAGGQSAAAAVMTHGDFYKAAVADCGCHDNRMDKIWWNEQWMGWPVGPEYEANSNVTLAKELKGKLFLIVGEMDRNVDPASTMQVVDALINADKDFDLLVVPGSGHGAAGSPYGRRRQADFFVRHLLGVEPRG